MITHSRLLFLGVITLATATVSYSMSGTGSAPNLSVGDKSDSVPTQTVVPDSLADYDLLDEVTVTGKKPLIQTEATKVIYNMEEDPTAATATTLDALRKVPMLSVDADGNVKMKGEGNFRIFLNGKPDPSLSANYKEVLRGMPASTIKKIEVITEPGAKYDAEGTGGIINIITNNATRLYGYTATLRANASTRDVGGGVSAMTKVGNVSASVNYGHNYNYGYKVDLTNTSTYLDNPRDHYYILKAKSNMKSNIDFGDLQLSWEPDTLNLFTLSGNLFNLRNNMPLNMNYYMFDDKGQQRWHYNGLQDRTQKYMGLSLNSSYQHNFSKPEHNIVASYQYSYGINDSDNISTFKDFENYDGEPMANHRNDMHYPSHEHTLQLDYTLPLGEKHVIETGAKYIVRRNYGDTQYLVQDASGTWVEDPDASINMKQFQDVGAVYGVYTGKYGKLTAKGGLRYEYTHMGADFKTPGYDNYSQDLNNLVPNAHLSYNLDHGSSVTASYQMRINRPAVSQLNPYRDNTTPLVVSYGNPDLTSQRSNSVTLTYSNFMLPVGMNISAGYSHISDMIVNYSFLDQDNVINQTYGNIGSKDGFNMYAYLSWRPIRGLSLSVNGGANSDHYMADKMNVDNDGWGWNVSGNIDYELPYDMQISLYGGGGRSGIMLQGTGSGWHYDGLAFSKKFLKEKRLEVVLSASGFVTPSSKYINTSTLPGVIVENQVSVKTWSIGMSVSYRLGSLSSQVKKTSKSIMNDDVQSGGGSSQPGGRGNR